MFLAGLLLAVMILPAGAPGPRGPWGAATVSDGDTLRVGATKVRLFGIDAPETAQTCGDWPCGQAAKARLGALVEGRELACVTRDTDRYGRTVATCSVDGADLGATLVAEGLAWAFTRYSDEYAALEAAARAGGRGVWRGSAKAPWDYRADLRAEKERVAEAKATLEADDCRVKGNVSAAGERIYRLPGTAAYPRVRISVTKGERWFCDETAAVAAGWRAPRG